MAAIHTEGLTKRFGEDVLAVDELDLTVEDGEVFGLVGPNGAGKTTTLRILSTVLGPSGGSATVYGHDVEQEPNQVREIIRYLPAEAGAYDNMTGRQYLEFIAGFYFDDPTPQIKRGVEIADLDDRIDDKTSEYSTGMMRKLLVASSLMTEPRLAILDEVTTGLDVRNARRVREIIDSYPDDTRSILLSSHDMLEVSYLCDRVALLNEGEIVGVGSPAELQEQYGSENLEEAFLEATG